MPKNEILDILYDCYDIILHIAISEGDICIKMQLAKLIRYMEKTLQEDNEIDSI